MFADLQKYAHAFTTGPRPRAGEGEIMRCIAIVITGALLAATPAAAQTVVPELHPYGLDPYKPSDAAILRAYGGTLVQQTPLLELRQLDPYKPSHAELLRQIGNGIPQWSHFSWYPTAPTPAPLMLPATPPAAIAATTQARPPAGNVILVPPNGQSVVPRIAPERPALPIPPLPQPRVPGSAPGGPMKVRLTPEQAAQTLKGLAYDSPTLKASVDNAAQDQSVEP
jgi:hypothetical protein